MNNHRMKKETGIGSRPDPRNLWHTSFPFARTIAYLAVICFVVIGLGAKEITNEGVVSLQGDMPRYLMNGVYFYDLARDFPLTNPIQYTTEYFAKYPALSIGHHPLLLGLAEVPFYALFGISVFSARVTILCFMLLAGITWFWIVRSVYNEHVAFLSSLLFVTSPMIVDYSRVVMSEVPALALILVSSYFFIRYCETEQNKPAVGFVLSFVLACYAKQMAIFMLPVFVLYVALSKGVRHLFKKEMVLSFIAIVILLIPLAVMTWKFSPANVAVVMNNIVKPPSPKVEELAKETEGIANLPIVSYVLWKLKTTDWVFYPSILWKEQVFPLALVLSVVSIGVVLLRREKRALFFLLWIIALYGTVTYMGVKLPRLAIYWIPPFCLFAALSLEILRSRTWRVILPGILAVVIGYQFAIGHAAEPEHGEGYEEAASYVVNNSKEASVMFSANVDTGYFTFFVRKFDPQGKIVVLRADKVLSTSFLGTIIEDKISKREEIYEVLKDFGTCYVVLEERRHKSKALNWLLEEVNSDNFTRRRTIALKSKNKRLRGVDLGIFEYKDCGPPRQNAVLKMNLPLVNSSITIPFADLIN